MVRLFSAFPSSQASVTEYTIDAYVTATAEVSVEALGRSVQQFITGRVDRPNRAFVPSTDELCENARQWQGALDLRNNTGPEMYNGLLECDWGQGRVDMRGLTEAEQDQIIAAKGCGPDGRSLAYLPLAQIREALQQADLAQVEGGKTFKAPKLERMP